MEKDHQLRVHMLRRYNFTPSVDGAVRIRYRVVTSYGEPVREEGVKGRRTRDRMLSRGRVGRARRAGRALGSEGVIEGGLGGGDRLSMQQPKQLQPNWLSSTLQLSS